MLIMVQNRKNKRKVFFNTAKHFGIIALALLLFLCTDVNTFAYDSRYLSQTYWQDDTVITIPIQISGAQGDLNGSIKYFTRDTSAYFMIDVIENSDNNNDSIYEFEGNGYYFSVDKNGMRSVSDVNVESKVFDVGVNFFNDTDLGHNMHIIVMDINDEVYTHNFSIYATINSHRYRLVKNLEIITYPPPTTTKPTTTKPPKTTKTHTSKKTDKASAKKSVSSVKEKTTKFKYTPQSDDAEAQNDEEDNEAATQHAYDDKTTYGKTEKQKVLITLAIVIGTCGATVLFVSLTSQKSKDKKKPTKEQTPHDDDYDF